MAIKVGEATVGHRMREAVLEVRRLNAAHAVALKKYNQFNDTARHLVLTPQMEAQQEALLKECQQLWDALGEANDIVRWYSWSINQRKKVG